MNSTIFSVEQPRQLVMKNVIEDSAGKRYWSVTVQAMASLCLPSRRPAFTAGRHALRTSQARECDVFSQAAGSGKCWFSRMPALPAQGGCGKSAAGIDQICLPLHRAASGSAGHVFRLGVEFRQSPFHLQRTFKAVLGITPEAICRLMPHAWFPPKAESRSLGHSCDA